MKELIADENGKVKGLAAKFPPGTVVYVDEAGNYAGHITEVVEEETQPDLIAHVPPEPLQEEPA